MRECDAADDAAKDAATGDKTASLDSDDGKTLAEALRLLQVADGLLYELNDPANDPKITSEMNDLVQFYNVSRCFVLPEGGANLDVGPGVPQWNDAVLFRFDKRQAAWHFGMTQGLRRERLKDLQSCMRRRSMLPSHRV